MHGALVERLRLDELVEPVVDVGEVDQRRNQSRIKQQRLAIGETGALLVALAPLVEHGALAEIPRGKREMGR